MDIVVRLGIGWLGLSLPQHFSDGEDDGQGPQEERESRYDKNDDGLFAHFIQSFHEILTKLQSLFRPHVPYEFTSCTICVNKTNKKQSTPSFGVTRGLILLKN